jgi:pimeloyl-[acyl-carrier protein] methyl ester esterase
MYNNFEYLIGLNSFINFLGSDQTIYKKRKKELQALRSSFLKDSDSTLRNFYFQCSAQELIKYNDFSNLDLDLILSDLQWLQKEYKLPEVPTLILSSDDDIVVPNIITSDNFSNQPWVKRARITEAGHAVGFRKPAEVYEKIMSFLNVRTS